MLSIFLACRGLRNAGLPACKNRTPGVAWTELPRQLNLNTRDSHRA
jgi:hypothetical protein